MSRLWPMADTACSVTASGGLAGSSPMAGRPAAIAPLVTTTTRWPFWRSAATSRQNLPMAGPDISPDSSVMDDVPTLATTIMDGGCGRLRSGLASYPRSSRTKPATEVGVYRSPVVLVVECEGADADGVAGLGAGAGQGLV